MKLLILLIFSLQAYAAPNPPKDMIYDKLQSQTEVFVTSEDGKILRAVDGGWSLGRLAGKDHKVESTAIAQSASLPVIYVQTVMSLSPTQQLSVEIIQWEKMESGNEHKFIHELKRSHFVIANLGSVQMDIPVSDSEKYVVRVTPVIDREAAPQVFSYLPISLSDVIVTDNLGKVWGQGFSVDGEVARISGPSGSVYLSFASFPGAAQMGFAKGTELELNLSEQSKLKFRSAKSILGANYAAVVFARVEPRLKLKFGGCGGMSPNHVERDIRDLGKH